MEFYGIRLLVDNFEECFDFYSRTLGWKVTWGKRDEDYASFQVEGFPVLSLYRSDRMAEAIGDQELSLPVNCREKALYAVKVEAVDVLYQEMGERGVTFLNPPQDQPGWGLRVIHFRDPAGNLWEFYQELPKETWDEELKEDAERYNP